MTHTTLVFVRVVSAVIVIVTLPAPGKAAVVLTPELVWLAGPLICTDPQSTGQNSLVRIDRSCLEDIYYWS